MLIAAFVSNTAASPDEDGPHSEAALLLCKPTLKEKKPLQRILASFSCRFWFHVQSRHIQRALLTHFKLPAQHQTTDGHS